MTVRVVIVDDSSFLIKQIQEFFEGSMGFHVVAVGRDGREAVELWKNCHPDLITMDLTMPKMDGKAAIAEIMKLSPEAHILVISAVKGSSMLECMKLGAKGFVEKPLKFGDALFVEDFRKSVQECLGTDQEK